jgi:hypothetical protein
MKATNPMRDKLVFFPAKIQPGKVDPSLPGEPGSVTITDHPPIHSKPGLLTCLPRPGWRTKMEGFIADPLVGECRPCSAQVFDRQHK